MRDPKRIGTVLAALGSYWHRYPDLRLGQILGNFEVGYNTEDTVLVDELDRKGMVEPLDQRVERIARAWFEDPGPEDDLSLDWDSAHPDDKDSARYTVRFVLTQVGLVE